MDPGLLTLIKNLGWDSFEVLFVGCYMDELILIRWLLLIRFGLIHIPYKLKIKNWMKDTQKKKYVYCIFVVFYIYIFVVF